MIFKSKAPKVFFILLLSLICALAQAHAQNVKKIYVLPFDVHASAGGGVLQSSVYSHLVRELQREKKIEVVSAGDAVKNGVPTSGDRAIAVGKALGVDYIITGSITKFGDTLNIDAQIIDIAGQTPVSAVSVQNKESAGHEALAGELKTAILSRMGLLDKIARVDIEGNRKIGADAIKQQLRSRAGGSLSEETVTDDIKTIFKMGFFLDVSAAVTPDPQGKILTFTVVEKGLISEIRITGNKKVDKDDILGAMTVKTRQSLNQEKIKEDLQKIKALYNTKGYYNAEITDRLEKDGPKDFIVIVDIKENDRVYVRSITFEGNEAFSTKELVNMMTTTERTFLGFITDTGILQTSQLKQDVQKLTSYYFNNGFVNAQIGEPVVTYDAKGIYIKMLVKEGKRFKIGKVEISGDQLEKTRADLYSSLKTKPGIYYNREAIMKDMEAITLAANDEGYAQADVNPKITSHEKEQLLDINFQLVKGSLIHIARIGISGNATTRDKVIRRQVFLAEGDLYSSSKLKSSYEALNNLRYFEEVDFQTEKAPDNKMDVNIRVKEKNTGMFMIGAGYSAVDQAVIMAQITQQNFLGYGQILNLKASLGSTTNNYEISFTEPWLFDLPLWCKADIWKYDKEYDSYKLNTMGGGLTLGYPLVERIFGYIGYRLSIDNIDVTDDFRASYYIKQQQGERTTSSVTLTLARDTTNDNMFPSKGVKTSISVQHAGTPFGGDAQFTKYSGSASAYYTLFWNVVFGAKGRIGYLQNNDSGRDVPIYERYVLGGINSLRGLRYIGPEDELTLRVKNAADYGSIGYVPEYELTKNPVGTADVVGGTSMLSGSLEIVFPLIKDAGMKGVLFYDTGNTWDGRYRPDDLRHTVGAGIRWYSPIGPLRLEYGYVLDRRENEKPGRWEFTIGMFM